MGAGISLLPPMFRVLLSAYRDPSQFHQIWFSRSGEWSRSRRGGGGTPAK